ncbi:MAG TPA: arginine--tRNA ligase [Candidatus Limnocylindrales bacterium]|nr:arginine--tRNA ligase [Candidatus Limnocylindrales bacterium]
MSPPDRPTLLEIARRSIGDALADAQRAGELPDFAGGHVPVAIEVRRPDNPEHGDLASNVALKLAGPLRRPPRDIAAAVAARLVAVGGPAIDTAEVAGPGFVNLRLSAGYLEEAVDRIRAAGLEYGRSRSAAPRHLNVEFVSANPTGPLTIGNARGAFVGDLLCRVLEAVGHRTTREYYFNDFGTQVENLGKSVLAVSREEPVPEDGYRGAYVSDLAADLPAELADRVQQTPAEGPRLVGEWASERVRAGIEASLERLGVHFDVWKSEGSLHTEGWVERGVEQVRQSGHAYEHEGALWFRSTTFGDDKDRVVIRSNGQPTYFAADIGYLAEKFSRGFDELVYVWGADHHGTVVRLRGAAEALGFDREQVQVLLIAWVRFVREGREISMSKRSGEFITLDELLEEVGVDAARWFFASRSPSTGIDFDIELARKQSSENPVYYVQYAHARISSILRRAAEEGLSPAPSLAGALTGDEVARGLARDLLDLPDVVRAAAEARETQAITTYATALATRFHAFYRDRRVVDPADPDASAARLALVDATRLTLAAALGLLGISAPDSM